MFKKFITILIFTSLTLSIVSIPQVTQAAESLDFTPQITIPGSEFKADKKIQVGEAKDGFVDKITEREVTIIQSNLIGKYIRAIYNYAIGIVGILAVIMVMVGGLLWLTSGGSPEKINQAKTFIIGALIGLALVLFSYTLLKTINSKLVELPSINTVVLKEKQYGCCLYEDPNGTASTTTMIAEDVTNIDCVQKNGGFHKDTSANISGTACLEDGCCKGVTSTLVTGGGSMYGTGQTTVIKTTYCYEINEEKCNDMEKNSDANRTFAFTNGLCETHTDCEGNEANCSDVSDGNKCNNADRVCYCYGENPYFDDGLEGEICGVENGSICMQFEGAKCPPTHEWDWAMNTRSCSGDLYCCSPN